MLLPIRQLNVPLSAVSLPALSRLLDTPAQYRNFYLRMVRMVAFAVMPAGALVAVTGDSIVAVVLGPRWEISGNLLRFFGIVMLAQPIVNPLGLLYISQGRSGEYVVWGVISTTLTVGSIVLGLRWGVAGVALCYSLTALLLRAPWAVWFACRKGPVSTMHLLQGVLPVILLSFVTASLVYTSGVCLGTGSAAVELAVGIALLLATVLVFVRVVPSGRKLFGETKDVVRHLHMRRKKGGRP
jgi:PST family polysaccharide transporter